MSMFWLFAAVVWVCDAWLYRKGYNTLLFKHKTDEEKRIREAIIRQTEEGQE